MRRILSVCLVAASMLALVGPARTQTNTPRETPDQPACQPDRDHAIRPPDESTGSGTLSDRLADSKGVICPPSGVDPGLTTPPPNGGRMPVIPPPGTPGGDPSLQPK